jgi:predicted Zn-dependent protease
MTEEKKPDELGDLDWDQALSEWESTNFVPEVAKDVQADKPGPAAGATRPLYRPPTAPAVRKLPGPVKLYDPDEEANEATRIARVPDELLRRQEGPAAVPREEFVDLVTEAARKPAPIAPPVRRDETAAAREHGDQKQAPVEKAPSAPRTLLVPKLRRYDPNEVTAVGKAGQFTAERAVDVDESPSDVPPSPPPPPPTPTTRPPVARIPLQPTRTWSDEKPASEWLSAAKREELETRGAWLEREARALDDPPARARALLACSEMFAMSGDRERARGLAVEARDAAPSVALTHRQARALAAASPQERDDDTAALDAEVAASPTEAGRTHAALLAAEALRAAGQTETAAERFVVVARTETHDVRAAIARATRALAGDPASADVPAVPEWAALREAVATCVRLRGGQRVGPATMEERLPNELVLLARQALDKGDAGEAASWVAGLAAVPELATGAKWLAASLASCRPARRADAIRWLEDMAERGDPEARHALVERALESGDAARIKEVLAAPGGLTSAERATVAALAGSALAPADPHLDAVAAVPGMETLAAALTAVSLPGDGDRGADTEARGHRLAGSPASRGLVRLGRLLAAAGPASAVEAALAEMGDMRGGETRAIALEIAARKEQTADVASALEAWGAGWGSREEGAIGALAAALVSERAGDATRAADAFKAARTADPTQEVSLRAIASLDSVDLVSELNELARDLGDGLRGAILRIEAATRGEGTLPEPTRALMLDEAHKAAPNQPIASFLAERIARRSGDVDEVLRWIREGRAESNDAVEAALDAVREALLVAEREPHLAGERLGEAHRARPDDMALRELHDRWVMDPPEVRAAWREQRAASMTGPGRALFLIEAAREFERAGDDEAALRCADAAGASDAGLGAVARERAEAGGPRVARLAEELLAAAKGAMEARDRREAYERLAAVDAAGREDAASVLLWHRTILEESPGYEPSLRHAEQHLIGEGRDDELEPIAAGIARALRENLAGEGAAHAELAARLRLRSSDARWDDTREMVELAASAPEPSLWSLRMLHAHARADGDDELLLVTTQKLLERASKPADRAAFLALAGETAVRLDRLDEARSLLEKASAEDPGDIATWTLLAEVRRRAGDGRGAAEAYEALARSSLVTEHQLEAWEKAARIYADDVGDTERAMLALEAAAALDAANADVFARLSSLYAARHMHSELGALLERRLGTVTDADERHALEVERGRVLVEAGDLDGARRAFEAALAERPEDAEALTFYADLCMSRQDWAAAEQALIRLARLLPTPEEQRNVYARLGDLYSAHLLNLSRAEVAFKEVVKRTPDDVESIEKLVDVYKRQSDAARAVELQQELVGKARSSEEKRRRLLELASIHEHVARDNRRAEQALEAARRELPQDVQVLRVLAEFYIRHHQAPAVNILLDRAGGDARRAIAAGRIAPAPFDVLATVFDLRDKKDAARVTRGMLAALHGQAAEMSGAGPKAFDPRLDDRLAPEGLTPSLRMLLAKTGDALDAVQPFDLRALKAVPLATDSPIARLAASVGQVTGMGPVHVHVSPKLGSSCVPIGSSPPAIAIGEGLLKGERWSTFLVVRAMKLVHARASCFARAAATDLSVILPAWLRCFNPTWQPQGVSPAQLNAVGERIQAALPRNLDPDIGIIALEAAGTLGSHAHLLGPSAMAWANRVALLALGDPNAAIDAIAVSVGEAGGAPRDVGERTAFIARTPEACDLIAFAVTDAFTETRARLGLDG